MLAKVFDVFGQVCEVVELGVEFWIFPGVLLARISGAFRAGIGLELSVVGCSFVWVG